jgi:hypothetical protein
MPQGKLGSHQFIEFRKLYSDSNGVAAGTPGTFDSLLGAGHESISFGSKNVCKR